MIDKTLNSWSIFGHWQWQILCWAEVILANDPSKTNPNTGKEMARFGKVFSILHFLKEIRPLLCPVFYLKSIFNSKFFLLSSLDYISHRATTYNKANIFPLDLQGGDSIEVSVSALGTGCPFSFLNPGSGKSLISWAFALDFPHNWKKKCSQSDLGEMGKMYFPSPSSSSPHPRCTTYSHTPSLCLFLFFSSSLAYAVLFWSLALVMTADWQSWQFSWCLVRQNSPCKTRMQNKEQTTV